MDTPYLYTVYAKITILRDEGALRVPIPRARQLEGELCLKHEPLPFDERTVPVLRILGPSGKRLYDPKVLRIFAGTIHFAGLECVERTWYAQEWSCEVFYQ